MIRKAKFDAVRAHENLRVIVVKTMLDWMLIICPASLALKFEAEQADDGTNFYPWPIGAEHGCIAYRLEIEPRGGTYPQDYSEYREAAEVAAEQLRKQLGLPVDCTFFGAGI